MIPSTRWSCTKISQPYIIEPTHRAVYEHCKVGTYYENTVKLLAKS